MASIVRKRFQNKFQNFFVSSFCHRQADSLSIFITCKQSNRKKMESLTKENGDGKAIKFKENIFGFIETGRFRYAYENISLSFIRKVRVGAIVCMDGWVGVYARKYMKSTIYVHHFAYISSSRSLRNITFMLPYLCHALVGVVFFPVSYFSPDSHCDALAFGFFSIFSSSSPLARKDNLWMSAYVLGLKSLGWLHTCCRAALRWGSICAQAIYFLTECLNYKFLVSCSFFPFWRM